MNKFYNNNRFLPIIGISLILVGYFFLTYQTFKLNEKKDLLIHDISKLEQIKLNLTADIKLADSIKKIQNKIIRESADPATVREGIELNRMIQNPKAAYFTAHKRGETNLELAQRFEQQGYQYLLGRNVENAIKSFTKSENSYNGYHQVYEISKYLSSNRPELTDTQSAHWKTAYGEIASKFSWKMPAEIKAELEKQAK